MVHQAIVLFYLLVAKKYDVWAISLLAVRGTGRNIQNNVTAQNRYHCCGQGCMMDSTIQRRPINKYPGDYICQILSLEVSPPMQKNEKRIVSTNSSNHSSKLNASLCFIN